MLLIARACVCGGYLTEEFLLDDVRGYRYLSQGHVPVPGMDDADLYRQLIDAMNIMGIPNDEQNGE